MIRITTNNVPRYIIDAHELTETERTQFDYLDWPAIDRGEDSASFIRYKGNLMFLGEFMRIDGGPLTDAGWHGGAPDSAFSGVVIRLADDGETAIVGWYCE